MAIELIDKIVPKNGGFVGMVDGEEILWANNDINITTTGDVGIGTHSPTAQLHIVSATTGGLLFNTTGVDTDAKLGFFNDAKIWQLGVFGSADDKFQIIEGANTNFTIDTSGNVDINNGTLDMNTHKIIGVVDPTTDQEAATKKYVDDNDANTTYTGGTDLTLVGTTFNVDDAFLKNDAADIGVGLQLTQDNSSADTQFTPQVLYNTDATPPAASGFPIGTIYVQYTA